MNRNDKSITLMRWQLPGTVSTNITRFTGPLSPSRAGIRAVTRNDTPVHTLEPKGYIGEFDNCRGTRVGRTRVPAPRAANFERLMNLRRGERALPWTTEGINNAVKYFMDFAECGCGVRSRRTHLSRSGQLQSLMGTNGQRRLREPRG